MPLKVAWLN